MVVVLVGGSWKKRPCSWKLFLEDERSQRSAGVSEDRSERGGKRDGDRGLLLPVPAWRGKSELFFFGGDDGEHDVNISPKRKKQLSPVLE